MSALTRLALRIFVATSLSCAPGAQGYLVGTAEVRQQFGVVQDTFPEVFARDIVARAEPVIQATLLPFGLRIPDKCIRVFQSSSNLLGYAAVKCTAAPNAANTADGDALVLLTPRGDSVLATILAPGGIELVPAR